MVYCSKMFPKSKTGEITFLTLKWLTRTERFHIYKEIYKCTYYLICLPSTSRVILKKLEQSEENVFIIYPFKKSPYLSMQYVTILLKYKNQNHCTNGSINNYRAITLVISQTLKEWQNIPFFQGIIIQPCQQT